MFDSNILDTSLDSVNTEAYDHSLHNPSMMVSMIPIEKLVEFKFGNSRKFMDESELKKLANSLQVRFINPITVRHCQQTDTYEVLAGNRRWAAAKLANLTTVPANILYVDDKEAYEIHIRENHDRENLSIVDEARAAQQFVSLYEGDYELAAQQLKWSVKIVKDRLNLLRCSESVLSHLETGKIELGHAIVLSSFTEKLQEGTLTKIVKEGWSVKYLKERAGKAKKRLVHAKFDTYECQQCPHNTSAQSDMFNIGVEAEANCANLPCWMAKTNAWLTQKRADAEERYGKVLLWVESGEQDRNTVAASVVGEKQYSEGCVNCQSNVVIMDDRDRQEGNLIHSQCIDKVCFTKCVKAHEKATAIAKKPVEANPQSTKSKVVQGDTATLSSKGDEDIKVVSKPTAKVIDREKSTLAGGCLANLTDMAKVEQAIIFSLVKELTNYEGLGSKAVAFDEQVKALQKYSAEELAKQTQDALKQFLLKHHVNNGDFSSKTPARILVSILEQMKNKRDIAVAAWTADKDTLSNYRVDGIVDLCQKSGFACAFDADAQNAQKKLTFVTISKQSKGKFIDAIVAYPFDWSGFAPESYLSHLK